jgi:hypothetical protein
MIKQLFEHFRVNPDSEWSINKAWKLEEMCLKSDSDILIGYDEFNDTFFYQNQCDTNFMVESSSRIEALALLILKIDWEDEERQQITSILVS